MRIKKVEIFTGTVFYKAPFKISLGSFEQSDEVVVKIHGEDGTFGIGEASPAIKVTGETQQSILGVSEFISSNILGLDTDDFNLILDRLHNSLAENQIAKAGFDIALYDLVSRERGKPLHKHLGGFRDRVPTDVTIGIMEKKKAIEKAEDLKRSGVKRIKVKVGIDFKSDLERVEAIRSVVGNDTEMFVDANQGWSPMEAIRNIRKLEPFNIDLIEQPVPAHDIDGLAFVRRSCGVPIAADEAVHTPIDAMRVVKAEAADVINIKLMKAGGISGGIQIATISQNAGIANMVGCMVEGGIGIAAGINFSLATKNVKSTDLDSDLDLKNTLTGGKILPFKEGHREGLSVPGLGINDVAKEEVKLVYNVTKVKEWKFH